MANESSGSARIALAGWGLGVRGLLPARTLDWIESADNYVQVHVGRAAYLMRESLGRLESRLDPGLFLRIHRRAIVSLTAILIAALVVTRSGWQYAQTFGPADGHDRVEECDGPDQ